MLVGLAIILPLCLIGFDLIIVVTGYLVNTSVCREAARAASIGAPNTIERGGPQRRANQSVQSAEMPRALITIVKVNVQEQSKSAPDADVFGGVIDGQVTVRTTAKITPPFFLPAILGHKTIEVVSTQTFPFTWTTIPNTTGQQKPPLPPPTTTVTPVARPEPEQHIRQTP